MATSSISIVRRFLPLALAVATALAAPSAAAQEIRGRVVEAGTQRGVEGAALVLVDAGDEPVARTRSDRAGVYRLRAPGPGVYRVRAERVGFRTTRSDAMDLATGATSQLLLPLATEAVAVAAVTVTARREERSPLLVASGFYDRKQQGFGAFMERPEIEQRRATTGSQMLTGLRGVRLVQVENEGRRDVRVGRTEQDCMPAIWIDGRRVREGGGSAGTPRAMITRGAKAPGGGEINPPVLDDLFDPEEVEAVEVYTGRSTVPIQFSAQGDHCGVILIWTRQN